MEQNKIISGKKSTGVEKFYVGEDSDV